MYEEIAKIIFDYSKKELLLDYDAIEDIIIKSVNQYKLNDYVKHIDFKSPIPNNIYYCGYYNSSTKTISINLKNILNEFTNFPYANYIIFNLIVVLTILHELDHIKLNKNVDEKSQTIDVSFSNIIDISRQFLLELLAKEFGLFDIDTYSEDYNTISYFNILLLRLKNMKILLEIEKLERIYTKYHDINPNERRANINSHIELNNVMDILSNTSLSNVYINNSKIILLNIFINNCLEGYKMKKNKITNSPSFDYIKLVGLKDYLKDIAIYDDNYLKAYNNAQNNYSLQERILYGLPLKKEEFQKIKKGYNPYKIYTKKV